MQVQNSQVCVNTTDTVATNLTISYIKREGIKHSDQCG